MEHLCASDAMTKLPSQCQKLVHNTFNYMSASAGRLSRFISLQLLSNEKAIPKKVLKPVATR